VAIPCVLDGGKDMIIEAASSEPVLAYLLIAEAMFGEWRSEGGRAW
jgi:hypothetical protein